MPSRSRDSQVTYFNEFFPHNYRDVSPWLVYMYRHGLAHQFTPKVLDLGGNKVLGWKLSLSSTDRSQHLTVARTGQKIGVSELYHLIINGFQFLDDYRISVANVKNWLQRDFQSFQTFTSGYKKYQQHEQLMGISKPYITPLSKNWILNRV